MAFGTIGEGENETTLALLKTCIAHAPWQRLHVIGHTSLIMTSVPAVTDAVGGRHRVRRRQKWRRGQLCRRQLLDTATLCSVFPVHFLAIINVCSSPHHGLAAAAALGG